MNSHEAWQKQQKRLEFYQQGDPSVLVRGRQRTEREIFEKIGIFNIPLNKPLGYLRLFPQDFIVEEKLKDGRLLEISNTDHDADLKKEDIKAVTLYANLIKVGVPTNAAIQRISETLNVPMRNITIAGLKDSDAITAQLVAISKIKLPVAEIAGKKIPNVHLAGFYYGSGCLSPGDLQSNIFTIAVRTKDRLGHEFGENISSIGRQGILNYFQSQRFGGLRLISHELGKLIMRGDYERAITRFLFETGDNDIPLIAGLRKKAESLYPDWGKMKEIFDELPYMFFNEVRLLEYLSGDPRNYIGALAAAKDQTQMWVYAYASFLFNKYLSFLSKEYGCADEQIPLVLSDDSRDFGIYENYLKEDSTANFKKYLEPFPFIQLKSRFVPGRIFPENIAYKEFDRGGVINFSLPKGSYATTFLANLFEIQQGLPIPKWVSSNEIDPKELLGQGSIREVKEIFKDAWYVKGENGA